MKKAPQCWRTAGLVVKSARVHLQDSSVRRIRFLLSRLYRLDARNVKIYNDFGLVYCILFLCLKTAG